jgi:hypothetical protein
MKSMLKRRFFVLDKIKKFCFFVLQTKIKKRNVVDFSRDIFLTIKRQKIFYFSWGGGEKKTPPQ